MSTDRDNYAGDLSPGALRHLAKCPPGTRPLWAARNGRGPRSILYVSRHDWATAVERDRPRPWNNAIGPYVETYDHRKGRHVLIAVAPCGAGCRCAAAWQEITP